jgi:hypothetical protein
MKRLEIIANRSIEEDLYEDFTAKCVGCRYTIIPSVHGNGSTGPKMGDHIWPEENFLMIIYCEDDEAAEIREIIDNLKVRFPNEGIKLFEVNCS